MAEAKATPAKKAAPKRKPAAKTTTKRTTTRKTTPKSTKVQEFTEDERQAMLTTYAALKGAGLPVPEEISRHVEQWIALEEDRRAKLAEAQKELQAQLDEERASGPWWVRNGYTAPFSLRLERQTERVRLELKPRGVPGDMHRIEKEDLESTLLQRNLQIGVIEIITDSEAKRIIEGQTHNMGRRVHTPTAILRNEQGDPYKEGAIKTEVSFDQQGVTVATLDPDQIQGKYSDTDVKRSAAGGMQLVDAEGQPRKVQRASQFIPTGGNPHIIENGPVHADIPQLDVAKAQIADDLARRKGAQGPSAALEGMRVTVTPTRKS